MLAKQLDTMGARVIAGCYTEEKVMKLKDELNCSEKFAAVRLDITNQHSIDDAFDFVSENYKEGIYALVNNAGIAKGFWIEFTSMKNYRDVMEVNFFGHVAMTKKFLPLIRLAHGRVINITSIAGRFAAKGMSAYGTSKFAFEAFSDCLRNEINIFGCKVAIIEPSFMNTPIVENILQNNLRVIAEGDKEIKDAYSHLNEDFLKKSSENVKSKLHDPQVTIDALVESIVSKYPQSRYQPGLDGRYFIRGMSYLPAGITDGLFDIFMRRR